MLKFSVKVSFLLGLSSKWVQGILVLGVVLSSLVTCGQDSPKFREYTETTTKGMFGITSGNVSISSQEIDLFNQIFSTHILSDGITWITPSGWKEVKESGVRLVSFRTRKNLEVTLIAFPGNVGGIRANLLRWLGQVQVTLTDSEISDFIATLKVGNSGLNGKGFPYLLVDFESYPVIQNQNRPQTIMAAIFGFSDQMLFVKIIGNKEEMNSDKGDFLNFIQTIQSKTIQG